MYISEMIVKYECENTVCRSSKLFRLSHRLSKAEDIGKYLKFTEICSECKRIMRIASINAKILDVKNNYGNPTNGIWVCPTHSAIRYYPNAIKNAVEKGVTVGAFRKNYKKIAEAGFPWQCPICNCKLRYYKEEELSFGYS